VNLRLDIETYSSVDLMKCGVAKYAEAADFQVLLLAYAFDEGPIKVVDLAQGESIPPDVSDALFNPAITKSAFNANFEITCLSRHFAKALLPEQWRCTSVAALYLGLPNSLAAVARALKLEEKDQKMDGGALLIRYFTMPCKPSQSNGMRTRNLPEHDPERWETFKAYCERDVHTERTVGLKLDKFPLPQREQQLWVLDQKINSNGIAIDHILVDAAIDADNLYKSQLLNEACDITGLNNPNSVSQLTQWFESEFGIEVESFSKSSLPALLQKVDDSTARRVIELRQELAKTSVAKYRTMRNAVCRDGRIRGLVQFYGANRTGRWAGRLVQVQNLKSNSLPDLDCARQLIRRRDYQSVELLYGSVPDTLSQLVRTAFVAKPNHRFIVVDFSAIEARVIAWLAGSSWRLDVFNGSGAIYEASAEKMFKLPAGSVTKKSPYRKKGKIAELALGYGGGTGALKAMGALDMGLTEDELTDIRDAWRATNPEICALWYEAERCFFNTTSGLHTDTHINAAGGGVRIDFTKEEGMLFISLPSGRRLAYARPRIVDRDEPGTFDEAGVLTYWGVNQKNRKWGQLTTWGGKLIENIVQAIARDCLAEAMLRLDARGYVQLMTVHDEIVLEMPDGQGSLAEVIEVLSTSIDWAPGLPLRADGFETRYYQKETD
jgi:DNA polymerase